MNLLNDITLFTCTFNNNLLTKCMIMSCFKQLKNDIPVIIMDNGTTEICTEDMKEVFKVIDNTNFKLTKNYNQVSRNHCSSIDYALKNCIKTKYVLLCDNDVLFKPSLNEFFDFLDTFDEIDCVGEIGWDFAKGDRLFPYFCIINVEKMNKENLSYFDNNSFVENSNKAIIKNDTGYSFYELIKNNWNIKQIKLKNYIVHLGGASHRPLQRKDKWLSQNKDLFM